MQLRYSKQREVICNLVKGTKCHPTADTVYQMAREKDSSISLGTVYRNLRQLCAMGSINTLETQDKSIRYDGDTSNHSHFICNKCGTVYDIFDCNVPTEALSNRNFVVEKVSCVYYGLCSHCVGEDKINKGNKV